MQLKKYDFDIYKGSLVEKIAKILKFWKKKFKSLNYYDKFQI
jgi:hypothetical protein